MVKNLPANSGDLSSIPGLGRFPEEGNGNPLQYSCLENPMDRGAWRAIVHGVAKRVRYDLASKQQHKNMYQILGSGNCLASFSRARKENNWNTRDGILGKKHIDESIGGHKVWWSLYQVTMSTRKHRRNSKQVEWMIQPHNQQILSLAGTMASWMELQTW